MQKAICVCMAMYSGISSQKKEASWYAFYTTLDLKIVKIW